MKGDLKLQRSFLSGELLLCLSIGGLINLKGRIHEYTFIKIVIKLNLNLYFDLPEILDHKYSEF